MDRSATIVCAILFLSFTINWFYTASYSQEVKIGDFGLAAQLEFDGERKLCVLLLVFTKIQICLFFIFNKVFASAGYPR